MIAKFKAGRHEFVRDKYLTSADRHRLSDDELSELLSYKNISENFTYCDWYGGETPIKATLVGVEKTEYDDLVFTIEINKSIPSHYAPSPSDILKGKGLLFPVGYQQIK